MTTALPTHAGLVVLLGAREFILPPMNLKTRKADDAGRKAIEAGSRDMTEESIVEHVVLATLQRNYPTLTADELQDLASYEQLLDAYITLKEEEARRMADLGKRVAGLYLTAPGPVANTPSTTSSLPSSPSMAEAGTDGNRTLIS